MSVRDITEYSTAVSLASSNRFEIRADVDVDLMVFFGVGIYGYVDILPSCMSIAIIVMTMMITATTMPTSNQKSHFGLLGSLCCNAILAV